MSLDIINMLSSFLTPSKVKQTRYQEEVQTFIFVNTNNMGDIKRLGHSDKQITSFLKEIDKNPGKYMMTSSFAEKMELPKDKSYQVFITRPQDIEVYVEGFYERIKRDAPKKAALLIDNLNPEYQKQLRALEENRAAATTATTPSVPILTKEEMEKEVLEDPLLHEAVVEAEQQKTELAVQEIKTAIQNQKLAKPIPSLEDLDSSLNQVSGIHISPSTPPAPILSPIPHLQPASEVGSVTTLDLNSVTAISGDSTQIELGANTTGNTTTDTIAGNTAALDGSGSGSGSDGGAISVVGSDGSEAATLLPVLSGTGVAPEILRAAKYHRPAVAIFFDSADTPKWDQGLSKNIQLANISSAEALTMMEDIVSTEGPQILVSSVKTSGEIQELIEILQLHFSLHRQMSKGDRVHYSIH